MKKTSRGKRFSSRPGSATSELCGLGTSHSVARGPSLSGPWVLRAQFALAALVSPQPPLLPKRTHTLGWNVLASSSDFPSPQVEPPRHGWSTAAQRARGSWAGTHSSGLTWETIPGPGSTLFKVPRHLRKHTLTRAWPGLTQLSSGLLPPAPS